jgi:hypothetical protein
VLADPLSGGSEGFVAQSVHGKSRQAEPPRVNTQQKMRQQIEAQQTEAQRAALRLDFAQFQRGQGFLALPPKFAPKSVTVRVLEGDIVLASRVVAL